MAQQKIFMTGAGGFVGSAIAELAIRRGFQVSGLSRSESSDAKLIALGVSPVRGDLHSLDILREQSSRADIVINLADPLKDNFNDYDEVLRIDAAAVKALGAGLEGTQKRLIITSGSLVVRPTGAETDEDSPLDEKPLNGRIFAEQHALALANKGINVSAIRLAPFVYGRGASGVALFMSQYSKNGEVTCIGDGNVRTSAVHVEDAAELYLLAAQHAKSGDIYNAVSGTVTNGELAKAIADILHLPLKKVTYDEGVSRFGEFFSRFLSTENYSSGAKAIKQLGWQPQKPDILSDILEGSYLSVAASLKSQA